MSMGIQCELGPRRSGCPGFTLPAVMVVAAAVLTLALGLLLVVGLERSSARGTTDRQRAELAARAGLEEVRAVLLEQAANDEFLVIESRATASLKPPREPAAHLYLVGATTAGGGPIYRFHPLFSSATQPADSGALAAPAALPLLGPDSTRFETLPWMDEVPAAWIPVKDRKGRVIARYAYWVEDLQGRLDAATAGNLEGAGETHARSAYPFPAPGLNPEPEGADEPALNQIALHALDPASGATDASDLDNQLIAGRDFLVSPGSVLAAAGLTPPLTRGADGRLTDPRARALEESAAAGIRHYDEQPLVPHLAGIDPAAAGQPKKNLNQLLAANRAGAIDEFAEWVDLALPDFAAERKGGFPDDYLKTLAANALDYADADSEPSVKSGSYRGLDAYPLVSEFLMRFRWENILVENGRKYVILSSSTYVELWNPSDQPAKGEAQVTYECKYSFPLGAVPSIELGDAELLGDPEVVTAALFNRDGHYWFPALNVDLQPNEYRVFKAGEVLYKIDAGPASVWVPSPLELDNDDNAQSGYRMDWNGKRVDQSRGNVRRYKATLNYPSDTATKPRQKVRCTIPGHSYKVGATYVNNMGDPRMACYLQAPQDGNTYPDNYSPNRRNIRWGTIYQGDPPTKPKVQGRVLPSEWPDGGHDSNYGSNAFATTDERIKPTDSSFFTGLPTPRADEAPTRISNRGRFLSETELGRVYDPIMWAAGAPPAAGRPWPDVTSTSSSSIEFGGGNTLRIGRPEHPRFDRPEWQAARLLDLFHVGRARAEDPALRAGPLVRIEGHVNLNTASFDALRALAAGWLEADPALARTTATSHQLGTRMALPVVLEKLSAPSDSIEADVVARAIIAGRPFASRSQVAAVRDTSGRPVFGNRNQYPNPDKLQWADAAAEEVFARVYQAATVRSRNFRVWVVGQALAPAPADATPEVLGESRMVFSLFADPGERKPDGAPDPAEHEVVVTYENTF